MPVVYNRCMHTLSTLLRFVAVVLVAVLAVTVATPSEAHADPLAAIGLATLAVCVVIVVAYLIIANASDKKLSDEDQIVRVHVASATLPEPSEGP